MKKKALAKIISFTMACVFLLTGCAGSASGSGSGAGSGTDSGTPKEVVDIEVMVYERGKEFISGMSTTDNVLTRWINEQLEPLGVHVTYVPIPRSGADDKVNLMLAGNEAPDVIMTYDQQRVSTYASQGGLVNLGDYLDRLDPDFVSRFQEQIDWVKMDGELWCLPRIFEIYGKSHLTMIRQDLVEELGMEMPTDRDQLIEFLYAVKEKYPDITPYGMSGEVTDDKFFNFLLSYTSRENERDNYIYEPTFTIILKPGAKEGLRQLNQFVLDGIIDPEFALDTDGTKYEQNIANGKYAFLMGNNNTWLDAYETSQNRNYHMVCANVLKNADGTYEYPSSDPVSNYVYVPKASEDKIDAIMTYLGWISKYENALNVEYGIEGVNYEMEDGKPVITLTKEEADAIGMPESRSDLDMLWRGFDFGNEARLAQQQVAHPSTPEDVLQSYLDGMYNDYYDKCIINGALKSDEYVPLLQTLIVEFAFKCMTAPEGQFDAVYEQEYQVLLDNHLQEVLDERAEWYDANIANK